MTDDDLVPVCWLFDWELPDEIPPDPLLAAHPGLAELAQSSSLGDLTGPCRDLRSRLKAWQHDRCAICWREDVLVEDHDHESGLTRGFLCRKCNTKEGMCGSSLRLISLYRWRHPTSILGLTIRYLDYRTGLPVEPNPWSPVDEWAITEGIGL